MDFDWDDDEDDFKDEKDDEQSETEYKPTYVLLALDVSPSMFETGKSGESAFLNCIQGLHLMADKFLMLNKTSLRSPLGVVLATNDEEQFHLVKFTDDMLITYNKLKNLAEKSNEELSKIYLRSGTLETDQFLTNCQKELIEINADVYKRILVFITNDDNPIKADDVKFRTLNIAKSFLSYKLHMEVCTFNPAFDYDTFYEELLNEAGSFPKKEYLLDAYNFAAKVNDLIVLRIVKKSMKFYPKRNDPTQHFEVKQYRYVKDTYIRDNFNVTCDKGEEVIKHRRIDEDNPPDVVFKADYGNGYLELSLEEKLALKKIDLPNGYTFLYVDVRKSKYGHYFERPYFMEVNSKKPNSQFFVPFWEYCFERNRVLVCARKYISDIRFVELIPKIIDKKRTFLCVVLPTSEDRNYFCDLQPKPLNPSKDLLENMSDIVQNMSISYNPSDYYSISLRKKIEYLKFELVGEEKQGIPPVEIKTNIMGTSTLISGKRKMENEEENNEKWVKGNITGYLPCETLSSKKKSEKKSRPKKAK